MTEELEKHETSWRAELHDEEVISDTEYCNSLVFCLPLVDAESALATLPASRLRILRAFLSRMPRTEEEWGRYRHFLVGDPHASPIPARNQFRAGVEAARSYLAWTSLPEP